MHKRFEQENRWKQWMHIVYKRQNL